MSFSYNNILKRNSFYIRPFPSLKIIANGQTMDGLFHELYKTIKPINRSRQVYLDLNPYRVHDHYQLLEQVDGYQYFSNDDNEIGYINIEFPSNIIYITNFSIKVAKQRYFPNNFLVRGFTGNEWITIKTIIDSSLCGNNAALCDDGFKTFKADEHWPFTKISFKANGLRSSDDHYGHIQLNSIELFGELFPIVKCSFMISFNSKYPISLLFLLITLK